MIMSDATVVYNTSATVIMPDLVEGVSQPPAVSGNGIERPDPAPAGVAIGKTPDTEAIAQAAIHHLRGDASGALNILIAVESAFRTVDLLSALGYIQIELGHHEAAAQTYSELMQKQPALAEGWFQWGFCLYRLGQTAEALQRFE